MQRDKSHTFPDSGKNPVHRLRVNFAMSGVSPPDQHVSRLQRLFGKPVLLILERGGLNFKITIFRNPRGDSAVHSVGVNIADDRILLFVDVFAPDQYPHF